MLDDLNADTILTLSMLDEPLLLAFVDLNLWDSDEEAAKQFQAIQVSYEVLRQAEERRVHQYAHQRQAS